MADNPVGSPFFELKLDFSSAQNVAGQYASNFAVQVLGSEIIVSFFQAKPLIVVGSPEHQQQTVQEAGLVPADCVGRIIISAGRAQELAQGLAGAVQMLGQHMATQMAAQFQQAQMQTLAPMQGEENAP